MPTIDELNQAVASAMQIDQREAPLKELRKATIMLEGDLKVRVIAFNDDHCIVRFGDKDKREEALKRKFMNFRYLKEKAHVVPV